MSFSPTTLYSKIATIKARATLTAVLVFLLPFERIPSLDVLGVTIRASQLVGLALIIVSVGPIINFYKTKPRLPKLLLPAFLFGYLLSALMANDLKRAAMVFVFTVFVALVGSAIAATFTSKDLPRIEKYLYLSTAIVLAIGFFYYFCDVFGLAPAFTGLRDIYQKEIFGFPRIQSTALEPLFYGSFLLIPYLILLTRRLVAPKTISTRHSVLFIAIITQLFLTVSRGAIYAGIVASFVLAIGLLMQKRVRLRSLALSFAYIVVGSLLALAMTWLPTYFMKDSSANANDKTEKLLDQTSNFDSQDDRVRNRELAIDAFATAPVLGIGPGNFSDFAVKKFPPYEEAAPVIVNNETLELAAEAGIIGFVLFMLFAGWTYILVLARYLKGVFKSSRSTYWVPGILAYLVALAIQYQTFSTLYVMHVWVVIGLLMAFAQTPAKITKK